MSFGKFHVDGAGRYASLRVASLRYRHIGKRYRQKTHAAASVLFDQQPFTVQSAPVKNLVGVDGVSLCYPRHRCARLQRLLNDPASFRHRTSPSQQSSLDDYSLRSVHLSPDVDTSVSAHKGPSSSLANTSSRRFTQDAYQSDERRNREDRTIDS